MRSRENRNAKSAASGADVFCLLCRIRTPRPERPRLPMPRPAVFRFDQSLADCIVVPVEIAGDEYPFLLDTGSASTLIDTTLAAELHLTAARRRVVLVTTSGTAEAFASAVSLTFGAIVAPNVEVVPVTARRDSRDRSDAPRRAGAGRPEADRTGWSTIVAASSRKTSTERWRVSFLVIAWRYIGCRAARRLTCCSGRRRTDLVLDSGATGIVLFDRPPGQARGGFVRLQKPRWRAGRADRGRRQVAIGPLTIPAPRAGIMPRDEDDRGGGGLLPTASFDSIYFDHAGSVAVFDGPANAGHHQPMVRLAPDAAGFQRWRCQSSLWLVTCSGFSASSPIVPIDCFR